MFDIGQKVVCANDEFHPAIAQYFPTLPKKGRIYTIRDIVPGLNPSMGHEVACYLEEIQGSVNDHGIERGFNVERFAPLNPVQEKILTGTKVEEPEELSVN